MTKEIVFNPIKHILGKICRHGHDYQGTGLSVRLKNRGTCVFCKREGNRKLLKANPEKMSEYRKKYYQANPDKVREVNRKWAKANPEKNSESSRKWQKANPEKVRECQKKYYQANRERILEKIRSKKAMETA